jgi:DNA repair and recombination protein RAD54B
LFVLTAFFLLTRIGLFCSLQVLIISYEMLLRNLETVQKVKFDVLVCDEAHRLKNTDIKTTSSVMSIDTRRRIALTGTPIQNDLGEFFAIVEFCNPGVIGTPGVFRRVYEEPIVRSKQPDATTEERKLGEARALELARLVSLFCLRRTDEINNRYLPPKHEAVLLCRPTELQTTVYRSLLSSRFVKSCLHASQSRLAAHLVCECLNCCRSQQHCSPCGTFSDLAIVTLDLHICT